jgi:hypothetical protein
MAKDIVSRKFLARGKVGVRGTDDIKAANAA